MRHRVVLVVSILTHYRVRFHSLVRDKLATQNIDYDLIIGTPLPHEVAKGDTATLPWATTIPSKAFYRLLWQPVLPIIPKASLIIVTQENRLLLNYILQLKRYLPFFKCRVAFFGHGRNFQARNRNSFAERWKRLWATRVDWWFGYSEETRRHIVSLGFPGERVTVFNNAVDTDDLVSLASKVTIQKLTNRRRELGIVGQNVCIYVGGIYPDKRLEFLLETAIQVRASIHDFELIIVGGGVDLERLRVLAKPLKWVKVVGPRFGADKVELMSLAKLFLLPGAVGLAVLDAGVMGLPFITTDYPWHGPEISYLKPGVNGEIVSPWQSAESYATMVIDIINSDECVKRMSEASRSLVRDYSVERMADRFVSGIVMALKS